MVHICFYSFKSYKENVINDTEVVALAAFLDLRIVVSKRNKSGSFTIIRTFSIVPEKDGQQKSLVLVLIGQRGRSDINEHCGVPKVIFFFNLETCKL